MTEPVALGFLGVAVPRGTHVCTFCGGSPGRDEIVLPLVSPGEAYLRSGRAIGEMPSVLDQPSGRAEFFRYEARLNEVIPSYPQVILCLYDLGRFGAEVLMDALRTHPMVIVDGLVHDNPYCIEPSNFLVGPG